MGPLRPRVARVLVAATVLQALFLFFFLFPAADPQPNGLDVAVVGPAAARAEVEQRLESRGGDVDVAGFADEPAARAAIQDRRADGGVVVGGGGPSTVMVASGGSFAVAQLFTQAFAPARPVELAPLPSGDPRGVGVNTLLIPVIVTSVLAAIFSSTLLPELRTQRRLAVVAVAAAGGAAIAVALAFGWLDMLAGHWLAAAGLIALAVFSVALVSGGIIRLIGPAGVTLPFLLFLMLGAPASGAAAAPELLPSPWYPLGLFMPPGALADGLRGLTAFDGVGVWDDVVVLLAWAALGVALNLWADQRSRSASKDSQHDTIASTA